LRWNEERKKCGGIYSGIRFADKNSSKFYDFTVGE
jgi:hypothetical protein